LCTDAITRLRPGPARRVLVLLAFLLASVLALASGFFDHSVGAARVRRECDRFAAELRRTACSRSARSVRR
jgi:hypothetical protein